MSKMYAAYDDLSIYALAKSASGALIKALDDSGTPDARFKVAPIAPDLAAWIEINGWDGMHRSFDLVDGQIVDVTEQWS